MSKCQTFLLLALLLASGGCDGSHSHDQDAAPAHSHDAASHGHSSSTVEGVPSSDSLPVLSPFRVASTVVDGAVLSGGDGLVLVLDLAPATELENAPTDEMVWFLNRTETGSACATKARAIAAGNRVRAESFVFTEHALELDSRHNTAGQGFEVTGALSWQGAGQFDVEITREVEDRIRIYRTLTGVCSAGLITGHSALRTAHWDTKTWSVRHRTQALLMVGIPEPEATPSTPAGEWRSVTLTGAVRRLDWSLTANRWAVTPVDGGGKATLSGQGAYSMGPKGKLELVPDSADAVDRAGYINPKHGGAVVYATPSGGIFSAASFWWRRGSDAEQSASTPGTWRFFGRRSAEAPETGLVSGTLRLAADGSLQGELVQDDTGETTPFMGRLEPGMPPTGKIRFSFSSAPSSVEATPSDSEPHSAAPHSH